jgi:hypothetical protein
MPLDNRRRRAIRALARMDPPGPALARSLDSHSFEGAGNPALDADQWRMLAEVLDDCETKLANARSATRFGFPGRR